MTWVDSQVLPLHPMSSWAVGHLFLGVGASHGGGRCDRWEGYRDGFGGGGATERGAQVPDVIVDGFVEGQLLWVRCSEIGKNRGDRKHNGVTITYLQLPLQMKEHMD